MWNYFQFNKAEFIGRTFAQPLGHLDDEMVYFVQFSISQIDKVEFQDFYQPPSLQWYPVLRAEEDAG